jgi:hypothetical protein
MGREALQQLPTHHAGFARSARRSVAQQWESNRVQAPRLGPFQKAVRASGFSPIRRLKEKSALEGSSVRKWVYTLAAERPKKAKESIPAKGGEKRCLVIGVGS